LTVIQGVVVEAVQGQALADPVWTGIMKVPPNPVMAALFDPIENVQPCWVAVKVRNCEKTTSKTVNVPVRGGVLAFGTPAELDWTVKLMEPVPAVAGGPTAGDVMVIHGA
jgi:hypothetical protein